MPHKDRDAKRAYNRKWAKAHPAKLKAYRKKYLATHHNWARDEWRWRKQGIAAFTRHNYLALLASQKGLCAICKQPSKSKWRLAVDHNHKTGEARALLCLNCNTIIGYFENLDVQPFLAYLKEWKEGPSWGECK